MTGSGLVLTGWGAAVLLVDHGLIGADRTAPAYMLGIAAGMLATAALAPRVERADWLISASITSFTAPLSLYLAYDVDHTSAGGRSGPPSFSVGPPGKDAGRGPTNARRPWTTSDSPKPTR